MFRPNIAPRRITRSASVGLFSAARNSVRNVQRTTNTISSPAVSKQQKFGMNFIEFFGSKKNSKILQKSLKTIRDSMVATFGIAKSLKQAVSKGAGGIFGFIGKIFGGLKAGVGVFSLLASPILKAILGIVALGGLGTLLFAFKDQILGFVRDKASGFVSFIKEIVGKFLVSRTSSPELQTLRDESESRIDSAVSTAGGDSQAATVTAVDNEISLLEQELANYKKENKKEDDPKEYNAVIDAYKKRIKELKTGRYDFGYTGIGSRVTNPLGFIGSGLTAERGSFSSKSGYASLEPKDKLTTIRKALRDFSTREDLNKAKLIYQRQLDSGSLDSDASKKLQAQDIIKYLDEFGANPLGEISPKKKEEFFKKLKSIDYNKEFKSNKVKSVSGSGKNVRGDGARKNRDNVSVIPMGNKSKENLVRTDTSGNPDGGPTMVVHSNLDYDNFSYMFNKVNFNIV